MKMNRSLGSVLIVTGTAIGAGMLALPVSLAEYGFLPSLVLFIICWLLMTFTSLLILEINLWCNPESNIVSMAKMTLGPIGLIVAWITYLLLLYALMAAYLTGMADLINTGLDSFFHIKVPGSIGSLLVAIIFGLIIYPGTATVDFANRIFITGKALAFIVLVVFLYSSVKTHALTIFSFNHFWLPLPIVVTSFGSHVVIPSLRVYLNNDVKKLRKAIIIGLAIPLVVYIVWQLVILGTLPRADLIAILKGGQPATGLASSLKLVLSNAWVGNLFTLFSVFAIATSLTGISFSLRDFLKDGLNVKNTRSGHIGASVLTFIVPLIFAWFYPKGFIIALSYAGVFAAILIITLPACMAMSGRYWKKIESQYKVAGGMSPLIISIIFSAIVVAIQFMPK